MTDIAVAGEITGTGEGGTNASFLITRPERISFTIKDSISGTNCYLFAEGASRGTCRNKLQHHAP